MSTDALRTEAYNFLDRHFPGSTLDDGYYFVRERTVDRTGITVLMAA